VPLALRHDVGHVVAVEVADPGDQRLLSALLVVGGRFGEGLFTTQLDRSRARPARTASGSGTVVLYAGAGSAKAPVDHGEFEAIDLMRDKRPCG
jgi:hypothetical protein